MKKTYRTFNGENRDCFIKIGEEIVKAHFTPAYTTDNEFVQEAIEESYLFKAGEIQVVEQLQWQPIDRDKNGFATEECLDRITELQKQGFDILFIVQMYGCSNYYAFDARFFNQTKIKMIREEKAYTHYLPIPKLEV